MPQAPPPLRRGDLDVIPDDLDDLYDWWRIIFARLGEHGVQPTSVREIMASVALA